MGHKSSKRIRSGISQLTIVEHALCPLDARLSVVPNLAHEAHFRYCDKQGKRQSGTARVFCPLGLSPKDELLLWGLLAITLADPQTDGELHATRHYCLRRLGIINAKNRRGGRQYGDFSAAVERLAAVRYQCDSLYDPLRAEHRRMGFGFFSYSIPLDEASNRAWRIVWDPIFFELVQAAGGYLRFDLDVYRQLDTASRRMYLFLSKLFFRKSVTPRLGVKDVAEQIVGIAPSVSTRDKKAKLTECVRRLTSQGVVRDGRIRRAAKGQFIMVLHRGPLFDRPIAEPTFESPLFEPLIDLGFDMTGATRLLRRYKHRLVREWTDITLAAHERFGSRFFKKSAPAYLTDNLKKAALGQRTPPDWWSEIRKAEQRATAERAKKHRAGTQPAEQLSENAIETLDDVHRSIFSTFLAAGQPEEVARANAERYQRAHQRRPRANST